METVAHWTQNSTTDFVYSISSNFVAQIETKIEAEDISQNEIAIKMGKTDGRVSQVLNNPGNLSIRVMVELARAVGMKVSIMAYDDHDPDNDRGPIDPDVFVKCWEQAGHPANLFEFENALASDIWEGHLKHVSGPTLSIGAGGQIFGYGGVKFLSYSGGFGGFYEPVKNAEPLRYLESFQIGEPQVSNPNKFWQKPFQPEVVGLEKWRAQQLPTLVPQENVA